MTKQRHDLSGCAEYRQEVDEISVAFRTPRTDAQIQADARAILERDVYLNSRDSSPGR